MRRRRGKFGSIETVFMGRTYHSKKEAEYASLLELRRRSRGPQRILSWEPQVPIRLEVNGKLVCTYIADFLIKFPDGHEELHETKGVETAVWRMKEKLFRALYPDRTLKVIR